MEDNYRIDKTYSIPYEIFREGYIAYQKKKVYPKSYIYMAAFAILSALCIKNMIEYPTRKGVFIVMLFVCIAFIAIEWYDPRKTRRMILDTIRSEGLDNEVYRLCVADEYIDISTVTQENVENPDDVAENEDSPENLETEDEYGVFADEIQPEKTRIPVTNELSVSEHEDFFILYAGKSNFYIIPKKSFSEAEIEILRNINSNTK